MAFQGIVLPKQQPQYVEAYPTEDNALIVRLGVTNNRWVILFILFLVVLLTILKEMNNAKKVR